MPEVSVIILNYNSSEFTNRCLASLEVKVTGCSYEVILVDNNSEPADVAQIDTSLCSSVSVFTKNRLNVGFSAGLMTGVNYATGKYLLFLNNDCEPINDCLSLLVAYAERHPKAALLTGQMYDGKGQFHHSFGYFPTAGLKWLGPGVLRLLNPRGYPKRNVVYNHPLEVPLVTGSLMFVRHDVFAQIGGFDTSHFLYCEEEDLAWRIKKAGYQVLLVPEAKFIHYGGGSTKFNASIEREYYISLMLFMKKHYGFWAIKAVQLAFILKLAKASLKQPGKLLLAVFLACGAPMHKSLRYNQKIRITV